MTREELIKKTEQLCDLYLELEKEGVYGILHSIDKIKIQCHRHTLKKFAGDIPTETRRCTVFRNLTETLVELEKFIAFTLDKEEE